MHCGAMIPANDFRRQWRDISEDALAAFAQVGARGWYVLGEEVSRFEQELAHYWNFAHAVGVASGLDALEISLRILNCKGGDKVLTTPVSAFATTLAIVKLGAIPVFADVDEHGLLDLGAARAALAEDETIRFLVPVHLFGHALNPERLRALQAEFELTIVEDCAQSVGALWKGEHTGSAGQCAATSFYPTKNLGALGDGGAVLTNDKGLDAAARMFRDYGQRAKYCHDVAGYNSRLDEFHASFLRRAALPRLEKWISRRREIAGRYLEGIRHPAIKQCGAPCGSESSWHLFPVLVPPERKQEFLSYLTTHGITAGEHYPTAIPDQPAMEHLAFEIAASGIERSRQFCRSEVSLPIHPYLTNDEVTTVIESVNRWGC
jgi:dTDP-3-amino-3,4,6-trideoxy-alpha-D-glucose transaminase